MTRQMAKISEEEWDDIAIWISDLKNIEERQLLHPEDCKELAELLEKLARSVSEPDDIIQRLLGL